MATFNVGFTITLTGNMTVEAPDADEAIREVERMDLPILEDHVEAMVVEADLFEPPVIAGR